jgi:hypothetical protein
MLGSGVTAVGEKAMSSSPSQLTSLILNTEVNSSSPL